MDPPSEMYVDGIPQWFEDSRGVWVINGEPAWILWTYPDPEENPSHSHWIVETFNPPAQGGGSNAFYDFPDTGKAGALQFIASTYDDPEIVTGEIERDTGVDAPDLQSLIANIGTDRETPFEIFNRFGDTIFAKKVWSQTSRLPQIVASTNTLRLVNHVASLEDSAAALIEIKDGYWIRANIMNENAHYFNTIAAPLSLDPNLIDEDFDGGDSDFTIKLYGGSIVWMDVDVEFAAGPITGSFYLQTSPDHAYGPIEAHANNSYQFELLGWGIGTDPNVIVEPSPPVNGNGIDIPTDPFDMIDGMDSPFSDSDGLVDRLTKSFAFGINGAFRAVEAVFEGVLIALPALIVIGSAVIMAKVVIDATEKGATKVTNAGTNIVKKRGGALKFVTPPAEGPMGGHLDLTEGLE